MQDSELKKKRKKKETTQLDERTVRENLIDVMRFAADPINSSHFSSWPAFPRRFVFFKPAPNVEPFCVEIDGRDICVIVTEQDVRDAMVRYYTEQILPHFDVTDYKCSNIGDMFLKYRASMEPITKIEKIGFKSDPGYFWHRLDFNLGDGAGAKIPNFRRFYVDRMSNAEAVCAWIGSLFIKGCDRSQYVWLYGPGKNGKGRLANFLSELLGEASTPFIVPPKQNAKGKETLVAHVAEKRLAVCEDCGEYYFVTDAFFKRLTGNDIQHGEIKYRMPAKMVIDTKFWFDSNEEPGIKGEAADLRRCIYAKLPPISTKALDKNKMDQMLWEERAGIVWHCVETFKRLCPNGSEVIPSDETELLQLVNDNEGELEELCEKFKFGPDEWCPAPMVREILRQNGVNHERSKLAREFKKYVARRGARPGGNDDRRYWGSKRVRVWLGFSAIGVQGQDF